MPVTLGDLAGDAALRLTPRSPAATLRQTVSWVHTSELHDPTPFLEGGELLLTTGLALPAEERACRAYVERLAGAGVAGLGFGVALTHDDIPQGIVDGAAATGMGLLEVARETPFIAISKAVSRAIAAEEYAELQRTGEAQRELARAASGPDGLAALVVKLAGLVGAWVVLLDPAGRTMHASSEVTEDTHRLLGPEIDKLRRKPGTASSGTALHGHEITLQTLGAQARGFLVVGSEHPLHRAEHHIVNSAASLLTLALQQRHVLTSARRRLRSGEFELLMRGELTLAEQPWQELGSGLPAEPVRVFVLHVREDPQQTLDVLEPVAERLGDPPVLAGYRDHVTALATDGSSEAEWLHGLANSPGVRGVGMSLPCALPDVAEGYRQAAEAARLAGEGSLSFSELGGSGLLRLIPAADAHSFAESLLAPLVAHDRTARGDLVASVREWLAQHGQWDPAAHVLGVHRHTLRNRIRKAEELLGRSLDTPGLRAELWVALQVHGQGTEPPTNC